jgi:hypothetical protein
MSSTRSAHRSLRRGNPALQAAAISGVCAIAAALIGGLFTVLSGGPSGTSTSPSPQPHAKKSHAVKGSRTGGQGAIQIVEPLKLAKLHITINPYVHLNHSNLCSWRMGSNPMPLASLGQPGAPLPLVRVDARCIYPEDPNPFSGVYGFPAQISRHQTTQIPNGTEVMLICYTEGQTIKDIVGNVSSIWLGIGLSNGAVGYIPDVNIGGGYTERQLKALKLEQCS